MTGPRAASFTLAEVACLAEVVCFDEIACFDEAVCFDEAACAGDLLCFDEPLTMLDSQPASLTSIGRSNNAAIAAMTVRQRGTPGPDDSDFLPDDGNSASPQNALLSPE